MINTDRFKGVDWIPNEYTRIVIIGAGGIGSWTALSLARIGYYLTVADYDIIESQNLGGQFYGIDSIGNKKIDILYDNIYYFCDNGINRISSQIKENTLNNYLSTAGPVILISAVDNNETRNILISSWLAMYAQLSYENKKKSFFIDGRLSAEMYRRLIVNNEEDAKNYKKTIDLTDDNEGICTLKQTTHIAMRLASDITVAVTNTLSNSLYETPHRRVYKDKIYNAITDYETVYEDYML